MIAKTVKYRYENLMSFKKDSLFYNLQIEFDRTLVMKIINISSLILLISTESEKSTNALQ